MVTNCVACKKRYKKGSGISFHVFPKDLNRRNSWMKILGLTAIEKWNKICSLHFSTDSFLPHRQYGLPLLKPDAIPTVHLRHTSKTREIIRASGSDVAETNIGIKVKPFVQPVRNPLKTIDQEAKLVPLEILRLYGDHDYTYRLLPESINVTMDNIFHHDVSSSEDYEKQDSLHQIATSSQCPLQQKKRKRQVWQVANIGSGTDFAANRMDRHVNLVKRKLEDQRKKFRALQRKYRAQEKKLRIACSRIQELESQLRSK